MAQEFYMTKCMSYREGEMGRHLVSETKEHIAWASAKFKSWCNTDPVFLYFLQEYKLFMRSLEASRQTLSMNTEKASSWDFSITNKVQNTYLRTLPLSHTDSLGT